MRLIDGNIQAMFITNFILERKEKIIDILQKSDNDYLFALMMNYFDEQPTAYSVENVVEELEELKTRYFLTIANTGDEKSDFAYENVGNALDKAIEIVKQGGVGTETETIRDKAVKWNNNSSKRVPYEFIDYIEGKREIGVNDDV